METECKNTSGLEGGQLYLLPLGSIATTYLQGMVFCTICKDFYAGQSAETVLLSFYKRVLPVCLGHLTNSKKQTLP